MKAERLKKSEEFLDTYLGSNRNISTLTWEHWVECLQDYADKNARIQIKKDRDRITNLILSSQWQNDELEKLPIILD